MRTKTRTPTARKALFISISALAALFPKGALAEKSVPLVDLSQDWQEGPLYNSNAAYCKIQQQLVPGFVSGYVVIQDGLLMAEGYSFGSDEDTLVDIWSVTKSWTSMLIGKMVELDLLSTTEVLHDIFDQAGDWDGVEQAEEKKNITVYEILTFTSGLIEDEFCTFNRQASLQQVLNFPSYNSNRRGKFKYLPNVHILAQIIARRTGMSPRRFQNEMGITEALGLDDDSFDWLQFGGIEGSAFGIRTSTRTIAKFGQLYLQGGRAGAGSDDQLLSTDWINVSTTDKIPPDESPGISRRFNLVGGYGYQWYVHKAENNTGLLKDAGIAAGTNGNWIFYLPSRGVVIAITGGLLGTGDNYNEGLWREILNNLGGLQEEVSECPVGIRDAIGFARTAATKYWDAAGFFFQRFCDSLPFPRRIVDRNDG